ncbi:hypothetical protein AUP68_03711 [Ilyonectria robusta]
MMASSTEFHAPVTGHYNIPAPHASHGGTNNFYFNTPSSSANTNSPRRPIPSYPLHSIAPTKTFVQRPTLRESIREQLLRPLDVNRPGEVKKVGVWGMGGAGKSQLALSYLAYYRTHYDATFWIQADQTASIDRDFLAIYRLIPQTSFLPPTGPAEVKQAVLSWFARESGKWLLVFDGADYLLKTDKDYVPLSEYFPASSNIHIIITSRSSIAKALSTFEGVPVGDLEESQSVELFLNCAEIQSSQERVLSQVKEIAHEMGHLALAINIAGRFVSQNPRLRSNLSEYLKDFRRRRHNLLSEKPEELVERYNHSVMTVWETSYSAVYEQLPEACRLLTLLSFIHNEDIFLELFGLDSDSNSISGSDSIASTDAIAVSDSVPDSDSNSDSISGLSSIPVIPWTSIFNSHTNMDFHRLEGCFMLLEKYSLCQRQETQNSYSIHRLIHCWGYDRLQGDGDEIKKFWHAASQFLQEYLEAIGDSLSTPASKLRLVPHLVENTQSYRRISKPFLWDQCGQLRSLESFAHFFADIGRWHEAELVFTEVLRDKRQILGNEHPDTLNAMDKLATTLQKQGQLSKAAEIQREALQKKQRILGNEHPDTLLSMHNLAYILNAQGQFDEALGILRDVTEKRARILGNEHPVTLLSMHNLAYTLDNQGQFDEALGISRDVTERSRRILGNEHPQTLLSMHSLAYILYDQGQCDEALGIMRDVIEKRARILGDEHPDTISSMKLLSESLSGKRIVRFRSKGVNKLHTRVGRELRRLRDSIRSPRE